MIVVLSLESVNEGGRYRLYDRFGIPGERSWGLERRGTGGERAAE